LKYVQNIEIKRLTSKHLPMYFSSMTPLFLLLASECFKTWNYIADSSTYVCLGFQAISRFHPNWQKSAKSWLAWVCSRIHERRKNFFSEGPIGDFQG